MVMKIYPIDNSLQTTFLSCHGNIYGVLLVSEVQKPLHIEIECSIYKHSSTSWEKGGMEGQSVNLCMKVCSLHKSDTFKCSVVYTV